MYVLSTLQCLPQISCKSGERRRSVSLAHHSLTFRHSRTCRSRRPPSVWQPQRKLRCQKHSARRPQASADRSGDHKCAEDLVEKFVQSNSVVGLGTGVLKLTVQHVSSEAEDRIANILKRVIRAVDVVFEEVDEIVLEDPELPFIAGRLAEPVQPNLVRMRELLAASKCNVMLVDGIDQVAAKLRGVLPVVVDGDLWEDAGEALDDIFIPDAEIWRRSRAGYDPGDPRAVDSPYLSAQGHNLLDVKFYGPLKLFGEKASYQKIAEEIESLDGVITHGLFVNVASTAAIFTNEGVDLIQSAAFVP